MHDEGEGKAAQSVSAVSVNSAWPRLKEAAVWVWDLACEHWFILGVGFAIGFAAALPDFGKNHGWIHGEYTIKYVAVIIIFLLSGMSLKSRVLLQAAQRAHLHLFVQALCLGLTPLIGWAVSKAMRTSSWLNQDLVSGLVVCTSMPTTVSTNVVFTKQAGGNEAVALINAVIGNVIGIFVSPGLLRLYLGQSGQAPFSTVLAQLGVTVIAPLVVGQLVQYALPKLVAWMQAHINFGKVSNVMILLLVWNTFCGTFAADVSVGAGSLVLIIFVCIALYGVFTAICWVAAQLIARTAWLQRWFKITRSDTVAVVMCGATKTLALGMPLISVLYGQSSHVALLALPLIVYHASQILQGNLLIKPLRRWATADAVLPSTASAPAPGNELVKAATLPVSSDSSSTSDTQEDGSSLSKPSGTAATGAAACLLPAATVAVTADGRQSNGTGAA